MTTHHLHRERTDESVIGSCSCDGFYIESVGNDESSRALVSWRFEEHARGK